MLQRKRDPNLVLQHPQPPVLTSGPHPVLTPVPGEEPVPQVPEEPLEGVGHIIHVVLALLEAHAAGIPAQHLQQAGGLGVLPALAVDAFGCQPCGRAGGVRPAP